ncbi:MAG: dTDP-4-dehydrorhamnose 3,5-epimerase family protein [Ignavibacteria bacterium]|jgi:dTDP-4-dehydrorhamnose 3,5-epimerase
MIDGVRVRDIIKNVDDRGYFSELLRTDWNDLLDDDKQVQINLSYSFPGIVRAWHRHLKGQNDYFICLDGTVKICAYDDRTNSKTYEELDEVILSGDRLRVARIPGILWHGYHAVGTHPVKVLYSVNTLYEYSQPDEERRPWNNSEIVPKTINGKANDPRVGKPWNWYYSPNK